MIWRLARIVAQRYGTTPKCYKHGQCIQDISVEMVVKPLFVEVV